FSQFSSLLSRHQELPCFSITLTVIHPTPPAFTVSGSPLPQAAKATAVKATDAGKKKFIADLLKNQMIPI
ncbi:MAG: hypothetical protein WCS54_06230, partial [Fibrobacteraceae bacterium]